MQHRTTVTQSPCVLGREVGNPGVSWGKEAGHALPQLREGGEIRKFTYQLLKIDKVIQERFIPFMDEGDI